MKRAIDLGPVEAAAIKTPGGKIRLRLLFSADQLEAMLMAAKSDDPHDVTQRDASVDNVTPRLDEMREEDDGDGDAPARAPPVPPTAPVGHPPQVFVIEGTRAWDAWVAHELAATGRRWSLTVRRIVDGRTRSGWHFPSLFPPPRSGSDPPTYMTDQDYAEMAK